MIDDRSTMLFCDMLICILADMKRIVHRYVVNDPGLKMDTV